MHEPNEHLYNRITRRQFPFAFGMGVTAMIGLLRPADTIPDEKPAPIKQQPPPTPTYGAWRPLTAGAPAMPTA